MMLSANESASIGFLFVCLFIYLPLSVFIWFRVCCFHRGSAGRGERVCLPGSGGGVEIAPIGKLSIIAEQVVSLALLSSLLAFVNTSIKNEVIIVCAWRHNRGLSLILDGREGGGGDAVVLMLA